MDNKQNKYQKDDVSSVWAKVAQYHDYNAYWSNLGNKANLNVLCSHIGNLSGKRIIEFGSGSGLMSVALCQKGANVAILDISSKYLEMALSNFASVGVYHPEHYLADALNSNLPSNTFDVVWNGGVIEHFLDSGKEKLILEMFRITKPGGQVIVLVPNSKCWQFQIVQALQKWRGTWICGFEDDMSPHRLLRICERLGLKGATAYAFNTIAGWLYVPKLERPLKWLGLDTIENHCRRSCIGFISVLVIPKDEE